jgi:predicted transcriptional regulator
MSPRAACRLETLGFTEVYDYVAGKADWLAHWLPTEDEGPPEPRVGDVVREDVVTAQLDEALGAVRERVASSSFRFALVVSLEGILLGRVRKAVLDGDPNPTVEEAMEPGPSTVRPDKPLAEIVVRLRERDLQTAVVTTPEGRLLGVLRRSDGESRLSLASGS